MPEWRGSGYWCGRRADPGLPSDRNADAFLFPGTSAIATPDQILLAGVAVVAAIAMMVNSVLADRTGEHGLHASAGAGLAAAGCTGAALLANPYGRVVAIALVEIGARSYVPPFLCLAPSLMHGPAAAAAIALVNTVFSLGGFVGPVVVGWFTDATGSPSGALGFLATMALAAAALCAVVLRSHPAFKAVTDSESTRGNRQQLIASPDARIDPTESWRTIRTYIPVTSEFVSDAIGLQHVAQGHDTE
jgi:MFS family permease